MALCLICLLWLGPAPESAAQWVRENYQLKAGYNAIWLSHDPSDRDIDTAVGKNPGILEVWRWNPLDSNVQSTGSPTAPVRGDAHWAVWTRDDPVNSTLFCLTGNAAYLIKADSSLELELLGKPLAPDYSFRSSGVNFVGFPSSAVPAPGSAVNFDGTDLNTYFSFSEVLKAQPEVYYYPGGPLSDVSAKNPRAIASRRCHTVARGQAYWVKSDAYTDYYGPLKVKVLGFGGIDFGRKLNTVTLRVKNVTDPARDQDVTANFSLVASENAPDGTNLSAFPVTPRIRGPRDPHTLQFTYESLPAQLALRPGEEKDLVLDANRTLLTVADQPYASILRVTDSLGHTRIDLPVTATGTSRHGVWVGAAVLDSVDRVETIRGPEFDAPFGTSDGEGPETTTLVTTRTTVAAGQTTRETIFDAEFDADGNIYLETANLEPGNVTVTSTDRVTTYSKDLDYTLASSARGTVTNPGSGYTEAPVVTLVGGGGVGATGEATLSASLRSVTIVDGGGGYTLTPTVVFTGGGGSGATGFATVADGFVTDVTVTNGGSGYTSEPTVDLTFGSGATADASVAAESVSGVTVTDGGTGYTEDTTVAFIGGGGTGAAADPVIVDGVVTGVTVTNGGCGYTSAPTVTFEVPGGSGAAATAKIVGGIGAVTITSGGSGYTSAPQVEFSSMDGNGSGAAATVEWKSAVAAVTGVDVIQKVEAGAIGAEATVRISADEGPAPAGTQGTTVSTVTTSSRVVTLNGKSHLRTRRIATGTGAAAPSLFPIRLILHAPDSGPPTLLQQVYLGARDGVAYAGPDEETVAALVTAPGDTPPGEMARVSSACFPRGEWWTGTGSFGASATFKVVLGHNAESNPFLHTYHPDHDNWDARNESPLPAGVESYDVTRTITLTFDPALPAGVSDLNWGVTTVGGTYSEVISGLRAEEIAVSGHFILHQVSEVPALTKSLTLVGPPP